MADDENEDQWLYGDSNPEKSNEASTENNFFSDKFPPSLDSNAATQPDALEPPIIEPPQKDSNNDIAEENKDEQDENEKEEQTKEPAEESERNEDGEIENEMAPGSGGGGDPGEEEEEDDDDSEDDVNVVIGEIKTTSQYSIKRGGLLTSVGPVPPQLKQPGKFSIEEFETIGSINGVPAHDFSIDSIEDKPWRKPGADITDYFNYGFNEETWRAYCERQKRLRVQESGVGLGQLSGGAAPQLVTVANAVRGSIPVTIVNDNSKYAAAGGGITPIVGQRKAGPPPGRRVAGPIDVLGGNAGRESSPPKGNVIQVMTADRREYSRKAGFPDLSLPPPMPGMPPPGFDPTGFPPPPPPNYSDQYYNSDMDPYYQAYEPTQDSQWMNTGWEDVEIKAGTPMPSSGSHHLMGGSETSNADSQDGLDKKGSLPGGVVIKQERDEKTKEKDRERGERDRSERERERSERHRERSHRHRTRSRSPTERRSRKHKSRSRSPGHRSHKKKKSKKSDRAKEESE